MEQLRQNRIALFKKVDDEAAGDIRALKLMGTSDPARLAVGLMEFDTDHLLDLADEGGAPPCSY